MASTSANPELVRPLPTTRGGIDDPAEPTALDHARHRLAARVAHLPRWLRLVAVIGGASILYLMTAVIHEIVILAAALLLPRLSSLPAIELVITALPVNFVYAMAMVRYTGQIEPGGIALVGDIGAWAARALPGVAYDPSYVAGGGLVSAVIAPGSSLLARTLAAGLANLVVLGGGIWLARRAARASQADVLADLRGWPALAMVAALVVQIEVAGRVLREAGSSRDLETLGILPFIFHQLLRLHRELYDLVLFQLSRLVDPVFAELVLVLLFAILAAGWQAARLARHMSPFTRTGADRAIGHPAAGPPAQRWQRLAVEASLVATLLAALPIGDALSTRTRFLEWASEDPAAQFEALDAPTRLDLGSETASLPSFDDAASRPPTLGTVPLAPLAPTAGLPLAPPAGAAEAGRSTLPAPAAPAIEVAPMVRPSEVAIGGRGLQYVYVVNGVPTELRGMGYNVTYAGLPPLERAERLARDFALMRETGINTVLGWRTQEWDESVLDAAQAAGIGVIMPYDLDDKLDYSDRAVRLRIRADVLAWMARYRGHPALRMWGIGNETLLHVKQPARARAFAEFYTGLVDTARAFDPDHPVIYREAEDVYVRWIQDAWSSRGAAPPTGFVLGMNFYTFRMRDALNDWPRRAMDVPLLISEFAPAGMGRGERAAGFWRMFQLIRAKPEMVIGAAPYVWNAEGPEPVDRLFGLTEGGKPVDSTLGTLRDIYRVAPPTIDPAAPVKVPALIGLSPSAAAAVCEAAGLRLGHLAYQSASDLRDPAPLRRFGPGNIIHQDPAPGTPIARGTRVDVAVGVPPLSPESSARPVAD